MLTKNAIGNLKNRYIAVLKKCNLLNTFGSLAFVGALTASLGLGANMLMPENAHAITEYYGEHYAIMPTGSLPSTLQPEINFNSAEGNAYSVLFRYVFDNNYAIGTVAGLLDSYNAYYGSNIRGERVENNGVLPSLEDLFVGSDSWSIKTLGGAIYNNGTIDTVNAFFLRNRASQSGGSIYNNGTIDTVNAFFAGNNADDGGAIHNSNTIDTLNASFIYNYVQDDGGAILNSNKINTVNASFIGNNADYGGAILNDKYATISTLNASFIGNSAGGEGGAIYNEIYATISTLNGFFVGKRAGRDGGAISNSGTISELNASFIDNSAGRAGAISNSGTINLLASNGLILFEGNTARGISNAIHNRSTLNINAGSVLVPNTMGYVHIKDNITGYEGTININDSTIAGAPFDGFVLIDSVVSGNNLNLRGGNLSFADGTVQEHFRGGDFNTDFDSTLYLDADLAAGKVDTIQSTGGTINGDVAYNILSDSPNLAPLLQVGANGYADAFTNNANYIYDSVTKTFTQHTSTASGFLSDAIGQGNSTFSLTGDYTVPATHNPASQPSGGGWLTVFGNNHAISASNTQTVFNWQAISPLNIFDATIENASTAIVLQNGQANIFNSTFSKNITAIDVQGGTANIYNSNFIGNTTALLAHNTNVYAIFDNTVFSENTTAIDVQGSTLNLAAQGASILFDDPIIGNGTININNNTNGGYFDGTILLNEDMTSYTGQVNLYGGTIEVGRDIGKGATGFTNFFGGNFEVHGGTLDTINTVTDRFDMSSWTTTKAINARIEADLNTGTADYFANSWGKEVNISAVQLTNSTVENKAVHVADAGNAFTLGVLSAYSPLAIYDISGVNLQSHGTLNFTRTGINPMAEATNVTALNSTFTNLDVINRALKNMSAQEVRALRENLVSGEEVYTKLMSAVDKYAYYLSLTDAQKEQLSIYMSYNEISYLQLTRVKNSNYTSTSIELNADGTVSLLATVNAKQVQNDTLLHAQGIVNFSSAEISALEEYNRNLLGESQSDSQNNSEPQPQTPTESEVPEPVRGLNGISFISHVNALSTTEVQSQTEVQPQEVVIVEYVVSISELADFMSSGEFPSTINHIYTYSSL